MNKGLEAFDCIKDEILEWTEGYEEDLDIIEKNLRALELIKKCFYVAKSSGAILLTDYGFEHKEELKEVLS